MKKFNFLTRLKAIGAWALIFFILLALPDFFNEKNGDSELIKAFLIKAPIAIALAALVYFISLWIFMRKHTGKYRKFIKETKNGGLMSDGTKREMHETYNKAITENDVDTANNIIILLAEYYKNHGEASLSLDLLQGFKTAVYEKAPIDITARFSLANYYCIYLHTLLILDDIAEADRIYGLAYNFLSEFLNDDNDCGYNIRVTLIEYHLNKHNAEKCIDLLDTATSKQKSKYHSNLTLLRAAALAELHRFDEAEALLNSIEHKSKEYLVKQINKLKCGNIQHIYDNTERNLNQ